MGIDPDVGVSSKDGGNSDSRAKVCERVNPLTVPRDREAQRPREVWDEEHDRRLVEPVEHVGPELEARVLQATDAAHVELRERKCGSAIDVLVESCG